MLGFITNKKQCENENCFSHFFNVNYISLTKFYLGKINTLYNFSSLTGCELQLAMKTMLTDDIINLLSLLHNFIQQNLNSGSAQVQILLAACQRFMKVRTSDNGPGWK